MVIVAKPCTVSKINQFIQSVVWVKCLILRLFLQPSVSTHDLKLAYLTFMFLSACFHILKYKFEFILLYGIKLLEVTITSVRTIVNNNYLYNAFNEGTGQEA
jgi:hypothetical protein